MFCRLYYEIWVWTSKCTGDRGGIGILNTIYAEKYGNVPWTIVEPASVVKHSGNHADYLKAFYDKELVQQLLEKGEKFDTLIHSHLMEHQYDINEFMELNNNILEQGGRMIFSIPYLEEWVKK